MNVYGVQNSKIGLVLVVVRGPLTMSAWVVVERIYTYSAFKKEVMERMGLDDKAAVKMWDEADKILQAGDEMAVIKWNEADKIEHEVEVVAHQG